jgi:hypothetical protein
LKKSDGRTNHIDRDQDRGRWQAFLNAVTSPQVP